MEFECDQDGIYQPRLLCNLSSAAIIAVFSRICLLDVITSALMRIINAKENNAKLNLEINGCNYYRSFYQSIHETFGILLDGGQLKQFSPPSFTVDSDCVQSVSSDIFHVSDLSSFSNMQFLRLSNNQIFQLVEYFNNLKIAIFGQKIVESIGFFDSDAAEKRTIIQLILTRSAAKGETRYINCSWLRRYVRIRRNGFEL